jgi:hypothetical protein
VCVCVRARVRVRVRMRVRGYVWVGVRARTHALASVRLSLRLSLLRVIASFVFVHSMLHRTWRMLHAYGARMLYSLSRLTAPSEVSAY